MKKAIVTILVLAILGGGGYGAYYYFYESKQADNSGRVSSSSEDAVHVDSVSMLAGLDGANGLTDRYGGEAVAQATLEVKLESDRKVAECYVKEGDLVKEGAKLFAYDTLEDEDKLAQAEIDIERAKSEIESSQHAIETLEKEKNSANSEDRLSITTQILTEENGIKQKEYEIKSKEREMEKLEEGIKNAVVTAEMGGIIQKINDPSGGDSYSYSYGSDSESAYITILATGDFRIQGKVNEQNIQNIYEGMPMIVFSRIDSSVRWYGMISEIDTEKAEESNNDYMFYGSSSADSSSYKFYVELESSEGLMLGQHVYMEQNVGQDEEKDGIWLEDYYLIQEDGKAYIWKASEENVIVKQEVMLGEYDEDMMKYEILEGIDEEDYIAYPMDGIVEGAPVVYNDISTGEEEDGDLLDNMDLGDGDDFGDIGGIDDGMDGEDLGVYDGDMGGMQEFDDMNGEVYDADLGEVVDLDDEEDADDERIGDDNVYDMDADSNE
ncbi:MAG: efflux RND transporter periplasmic adaptor subunit [Lachnospiraceae bacterium]|nr:efflux RND transporter periplasmic adaptor subunit [Lachnospiraceae bacterium]